MRWKWTLLWLWIVVSPTAWAQQPTLVNENSTLRIELTFRDTNNALSLPTSFNYSIYDRESKLELTALTAVANPAGSPCDDPNDGCSQITIPASENIFVGTCENLPQRWCKIDGDCTAYGGGECEKLQEKPQEHVLTVDWTWSGGQGSGRQVFQVRNLEFLPAP